MKDKQLEGMAKSFHEAVMPVLLPSIIAEMRVIRQQESLARIFLKDFK